MKAASVFCFQLSHGTKFCLESVEYFFPAYTQARLDVVTIPNVNQSRNMLIQPIKYYYVSRMRSPNNKASHLVSYTPQCDIPTYLRVRAFFHKTVRVCHVYCNFKLGFTCRITVIFGTLKDGSLLINTLASNI